MFLREIIKLNKKNHTPDQYPLNVPAIKHFDKITLNKNVTFFVGENGSGISSVSSHRCSLGVLRALKDLISNN